MLHLSLIERSCPTCLLGRARRQLAGRNRSLPHGRIARLARRAGASVAVGTVVALSFAAPAHARSFLPLPSLKVPVRHAGYQLATDGGEVLPFGAAARGAAPATGLAHPAVGVARTPTGAGAWTVTADGGVVTSGDAPFFGSLGGTALRRPIVDIAATRTGRGYWLVSADGGVFSFGDAGFFGTPFGLSLQAPVVGLVPTPSGRGYWVATADGGVFTFGDAPFAGAVDVPLHGWVTSMAATPSGAGYWLASVDGGVFTFGDARFYGAPAGRATAAVVGIATSRTGRGYWVATADGGVFTFGDAPFLGSSVGRSKAKVVDIAAGTSRLRAAEELAVVTPRLRNRFGNDVSWPQCDSALPAPGYGFGIVGVTGGRPFSRNRCLDDQWRWATDSGAAGSVYVNLASPYFGDPAALQGPAGGCAPTDLPCQVYNFSANTVQDAMAYAAEAGVDAPMWWLDVEVANHWTGNQALNALSVRAAAETLAKAGHRAGVYSTALMWRRITGGAELPLPVWVAGAPTDAEAPTWCGRPDKDFTGGGIWMVQSLPTVYDVNYLCPPALEPVVEGFRFAPEG